MKFPPQAFLFDQKKKTTWFWESLMREVHFWSLRFILLSYKKDCQEAGGTPRKPAYQASVWALTWCRVWALIFRANEPQVRVSERARREKPISGLCGSFGQVSQKVLRGSQIAFFWAALVPQIFVGSGIPRPKSSVIRARSGQELSRFFGKNTSQSIFGRTRGEVKGIAQVTFSLAQIHPPHAVQYAPLL